MRPKADFLLRQTLLIAIGASALNQPCRGRALEKRLKTSPYRVLKHGTLARTALPSFHTPISSSRIARPSVVCVNSRGAATALRYTDSPSYRTPVHRVVRHATTAQPYTKKRPDTVSSYTTRLFKPPQSLGFSSDNCTKLRSKLYNRRVDVFGMRRGGAS